MITITIQNTTLNANKPSRSKMSNIKKSVTNIHPNTQMISAITIIDNKNDKHPLISFMNFVSVLIQELLPTYQNYPVLLL